MEYCRREKPGAKYLASDTMSILESTFKLRLTLNDEFLPIEETHVGDSWVRDLDDYRYTSKHGIKADLFYLATTTMLLSEIKVLSFPNVLVVITTFLSTKTTNVPIHITISWKASQQDNNWTVPDTSHFDYLVVGPHIFLFLGSAQALPNGQYECCFAYLDPKKERVTCFASYVTVENPHLPTSKFVGYDGLFYQPWVEEGEGMEVCMSHIEDEAMVTHKEV